MIQSGGWLVSKDGKTATVNSKANVAAFNYVKGMIKAGTFKLTNQLGAGWGGEAFGKGMCAMTIEGNWIAGAMTHDYPTVKYKALQLPSGPAGKGTLQYDGGWGMAAASKNKTDAMSLITYLTSPKVQMGNAKAFGVMPSVKANAAEWSKLYPQFAAFLAGAEYSKSIPTVPDIATVLGTSTSRCRAPEVGREDDPGSGQRELQSILTASQRRGRPAGGAAPPAGAHTRGGECCRTGSRWRRDPGIRGHQAAAGWLFLAPVIVILGLFLVLPIVMAALGQLLRLERQRQPARRHAHFVGLDNYRHLSRSRASTRTTSARRCATTSTTSCSSCRCRRSSRSSWRCSSTAASGPSGSSGRPSTSPRSRARSRSPILFLFLFSPSGVVNELLSSSG